MSTRATYQFIPAYTSHHTGATIYVHYDGYPDGAAAYFYAALSAENQRGGLATTFIKANPLAELTESHDRHGDTEYRYTVRGCGSDAQLTAHHRGYNDGDDWGVFYVGLLRDFVDRHRNNMPETLQQLNGPLFREFEGQYLTMPEAQRKRDRNTATAAAWRENGVGQPERLDLEAARLLALFPELETIGA